jgi:AcrR family transcriptional regulator
MVVVGYRREVPTRLSRAESQARTRRAVLDAAADLFARRGYHATSIEDIAMGAGLTRGAIYSNFASKQDLLVAVITTASSLFDDAVFGDESLTFPQRLRVYAHHLMADWTKIRRAILLYSELELLAARDPKLRGKVAAAWEPLIRRQGADLDAVSPAQGVQLPLDGLSMMVTLGAAVRGLLRERLVFGDLIDEQLLGDALLLVCAYNPADHPVPE